MFVKNLDKEKQAAFLNLAYTMIYADGRLDDREQQLFDSYSLEIDADFSKAHVVDFEKELLKFDNCTQAQKLGIFYEIYAIALIDESYPEQEKVLIDIMQKYFGVTEEKMQEMRKGLQKLIDAIAYLKKIVES